MIILEVYIVLLDLTWQLFMVYHLNVLCILASYWTECGLDFCNYIHSTFHRFEQYVDYALDVPMYFVYRNKKYVNCSGMSFKVPICAWSTFLFGPSYLIRTHWKVWQYEL